MIRAPIPTTTRARRNTRILPDNQPHIRIQRRIRIIGKHNWFASWRIPRHILLQHGEDSLASRSVVREDGCGTEESSFFSGVEVEFQRVFGLES